METAEAITEVLGGRKVLGKAIKKPGDLAQLVRDGLPASSVAALAQKLHLGNSSEPGFEREAACLSEKFNHLPDSHPATLIQPRVVRTMVLIINSTSTYYDHSSFQALFGQFSLPH